MTEVIDTHWQQGHAAFRRGESWLPPATLFNKPSGRSTQRNDAKRCRYIDGWLAAKREAGASE